MERKRQGYGGGALVSSSQPSSIEAAFRDQCGGSILGVDASPEQLDLLRGDDGKLPQDVFRKMRVQERTGPGRKPGSRNKANADLAKLICQQHGDPVLFMASVYSRPLDQLVELMLIADSTAEREERLLEVVDKIDEKMKFLTPLLVMNDPKIVNNITNLLDRLVDIAKGLKSKPGDIAIKALNTQLAAAKSVAEYTHSKKPVEIDANVKLDGMIVMPPASPGDGMAQMLQNVAKAINDGTIDPLQLADMRLIEGEFVEVRAEEDDEDE